jgi:cytochrome P450
LDGANLVTSAPPATGQTWWRRTVESYRFRTDPFGAVLDTFDRYGDVCQVGPWYWIRHPQHIGEVFLERGDRFSKRMPEWHGVAALIGNGLLTSDDELWHRQRRCIQPAFAHDPLTAYAESMADEASRLASEWQDGDQRDIAHDLHAVTLRVISRALFGDDDAPANAVLTSRLDAILRQVGQDKTVDANQRLELANRATRELDALMLPIVAERRRRPRTPRADMIQQMIDAHGDGSSAPFSDQEIVDELKTFYFAGHDTVWTAATFACDLMARDANVQDRVRREIASVLGDRLPTADDADRLPYLRQVCLETVRLYPPIYNEIRRTEDDIDFGSHRVPKGSTIVVWIYATHRDARWFPEPERFNPARFASPSSSRPPAAYLPFGLGPRTCIGKKFALIEMSLVLATLLRRFRLEPIASRRLEPSMRVYLAPATPLAVRLRKQQAAA